MKQLRSDMRIARIVICTILITSVFWGCASTEIVRHDSAPRTHSSGASSGQFLHHVLRSVVSSLNDTLDTARFMQEWREIDTRDFPLNDTNRMCNGTQLRIMLSLLRTHGFTPFTITAESFDALYSLHQLPVVWLTGVVFFPAWANAPFAHPERIEPFGSVLDTTVSGGVSLQIIDRIRLKPAGVVCELSSGVLMSGTYAQKILGAVWHTGDTRRQRAQCQAVLLLGITREPLTVIHQALLRRSDIVPAEFPVGQCRPLP